MLASIVTSPVASSKKKFEAPASTGSAFSSIAFASCSCFLIDFSVRVTTRFLTVFTISEMM